MSTNQSIYQSIFWRIYFFGTIASMQKITNMRIIFLVPPLILSLPVCICFWIKYIYNAWCYYYYFLFIYLLIFLFPHLEKVYHFWMSCGCCWNPGPCYLPTSEMIWVWTRNLWNIGDRRCCSLRPIFSPNVMKTASTYLKDYS